MNLDFAKVCGKHNAIYEAYYKQIDPKGSGAIEAMTAAKFLKKSGLSDVVLSKVWDLSDPNGKGFLDKPGFFVALKLVSLAQAGQVANMSNIYVETANPPKVGDLPKIIPPRIQTVPVGGGGASNGDWSISVIDRLKYEQLFESLKPVGGMLPGNKVKGVLMDSKLPMETLGKIWDLADQDKDGNLDKHEFIVAMHLVYQTLEKRTVPDVLPMELRKSGHAGPPPPKPMPPAVTPNTAASMSVAPTVPRAPSGEGFSDGGFVANFPKDIAPPPVPPLPTTLPSMGTRVPPVGSVAPLIPTDPLIPIGAPPSVSATADWVVTPAELKRFEVIFRDSDRDKDGLVSGLEVKNVFLQSGVPQQCLAHIWALCDTNQSGKLTLEQFALAMWMVERKQKGIEPPQVLTANMVPPSMRNIVTGVDLQAQVEPKPTYSNPELEMISKEIEELAKERRALETEIAQKEADIRIKSGEVRSLQSELDTLSATLKQLENQRGEAQKRLDDLKAQSTEYHDVIDKLNLELSHTRNQVNKIREQCQKQEDTITEQEGELNAKRSELQKLKDEETALQREYDDNNKELQKLTQHLQNTQLQISSVRSMVTQLMETQRQMTDALLMCRAAIESQDGELVSEYQLKIEPDFDDARKTLEKKIDEPKATIDPFEDSASTNTVKPTSNGFATNNGFGSDPFAGTGSAGGIATARGGFDDSFNTSSGFDSGFDAFGTTSHSSSGGTAFGQQKDPFGGDAFGSASKPHAITPEPGKDDFGSDPFAALHAPTGQGQVLSPNAQKSGPPPRPESPSPALPPKKSKVPPPRPAPPRPLQAPARPPSVPADSFGATSNSGGFADFADFDNKLAYIPTAMPVASNPLGVSMAGKLSAPTASLDEISLFDAFTSTSVPTAVTSSTKSASSTPIIPSTAINSHLTRSTTPLQQMFNDVVTTMPTTSTSAPTTVTRAPNNAVNTIAMNVNVNVKGPTDFSDDPFKDYRYEDPFNIQDPFADDQQPDPSEVFKDDLSSDDDKPKPITKPNQMGIASVSPVQPFAATKSTSPLGFATKFADLSISVSPVPSQKSTASASKSQSHTPVPMTATGGGSLFDNFADFDAFATQSATNAKDPNANCNLTSENIGRNNNNNNDNDNLKANDSFFNAFNDHFEANRSRPNSGLKKSNTNTTANVLDAFGDEAPFDAFNPQSSAGLAATTTTNTIVAAAKLFDDDEDAFGGDDFFKTKESNIIPTTASAISTTIDNNSNSNAFAFDMNKNTNMKTTTVNAIDNFAKFDAFGDGNDFDANYATALNNSINVNTKNYNSKVDKLNMIQNPTHFSKTSNIAVAAGIEGATAASAPPAKPPTKFAADYSNPDTFDADLEEALKRSMLEQ